MSLITVIADGKMSAANEIEKELNKNESRYPLFVKWVKNGMLIEKV